MESNKRAANNTDRRWGRPTWHGNELSPLTFFLLSLGLVAVVITAAYYIFAN